MPDKNINIDTDVILRYLEKTASPEEIRQLREWIALSEENANYFQEIRNIWEVATPAVDPEKIDTGKALAKVKHRIQTAPQAPAKKTRLITYCRRIAAILLLPAIIAVVALLMKKDHQAPLIAFNEVTAPYGTVSTLTLPDSSKVWLNAGSTLKYPTAFTNSVREVEMSGEAYFEVHADKEHPFIVSTGNLKVTATGTAFNVCSFAKAKEEIITLVTGKVNVSHENNIRHLLPGQQLNYQKASKSMEVTDIDTYQYISWKDGILAFRDDPLETIFDRLEQVYQVRFILKDPSISQFTYRATFKGEPLDEILDYMGMSIPITFRTTETKQEGNDSVSVRTIEVYKN